MRTDDTTMKMVIETRMATWEQAAKYVEALHNSRPTSHPSASAQDIWNDALDFAVKALRDG